MVAYANKVGRFINADPYVAGAMVRRELQRRRLQWRRHQHHAEAAGNRRQLMRRTVMRELRRKVSQLHRRQCLPAQSAGDPHRRPRLRAPPINTRWKAWTLTSCRTSPAKLVRAAADHAGLCRRQQRFRQCRASVGSQHRPRPAPRRLGVTPGQIENAMGYAFGGQRVSQIYASSDQYQVMLELLPRYQRNVAVAATACMSRPVRDRMPGSWCRCRPSPTSRPA